MAPPSNHPSRPTSSTSLTTGPTSTSAPTSAPTSTAAPSALTSTSTSTNTTRPSSTSRLSTLPSQKPRQLSHLHAQLAQLTAHVSDLENLLRMTAVQAESMRGLGGYAGGMFMAASKILGEETVNSASNAHPHSAAGAADSFGGSGTAGTAPSGAASGQA